MFVFDEGTALRQARVDLDRMAAMVWTACPSRGAEKMVETLGRELIVPAQRSAARAMFRTVAPEVIDLRLAELEIIRKAVFELPVAAAALGETETREIVEEWREATRGSGLPLHLRARGFLLMMKQAVSSAFRQDQPLELVFEGFLVECASAH